MDIKSIIYKATFIFTITLAIISIVGLGIKIEAIDQFLNVSTIPIFLFNILIIINSINETIGKKAEDKKQYYKQFENNYQIKEEERIKLVNNEVIYGDICELSDIKIKRILSTVCVAVIVAEFLLICFKEYCNEIFKNFNFNVVSIFSLSVLIIDIYYKDKIANKILNKMYIYKNNKKDF